MMKFLSFTFFSLGIFCSFGCSSFSYLLQAGKGQLALLNHAVPLPEALNDKKIQPHIRLLLSQVDLIKKWGEIRGLKSTRNYKEYVKIDRPYVIWAVSACRPLEFRAKYWSFPFVGSFPYLGWFHQEEAMNFAHALENEGWDVDVRGVSAYSTVGWFRDPILSTMLGEGDFALGNLVNIILHESVHSTFYIENQSVFNESIAHFIGDHLTLEYLDEVLGKNSEQKKSYLQLQENNLKVRNLLHEVYLDLEKIYSSTIYTDEGKRKMKEKTLNQLNQKIKSKHPINNATLMQYQTYHTDQDALESLFKNCAGQWACFMKVIRSIRPDSFEKKQQENFKKLLPI